MAKGIQVRGKSLRIVFWWKEKSHSHTFGSPTPENRSKAKRALRQIKDHIEAGTFNENVYQAILGKSYKKSGISLHKTIDRFEEERRMLYKVGKLPEGTFETEQNSIRKLKTAFSETEKVTEVTLNRIYEFETEMMDGSGSNQISLKRSTINRHISILRKVLTFAFREKLIDLNPFDYYEATNRPANVITRDDVFHFEDLQKLREGNYEHQALYNFFEFIFFTGLRPNEAAALKMKQVYDEPDPYILAFLPKKKITIQNTLSTGKFKSVKTPTSHRTLTLHPLAKKCLDRHAKYRNMHYEKDNINHDYVFFFDDDFKPMDSSDKIRKRYMTLHARSGLVSRIPPKNFRHSFAVAMLIGGASPFFIAQYMGHADLQMLYKIYGDMINQDAEMRELQKFWVDSTYEESQRDELERENLLPDLSW